MQRISLSLGLLGTFCLMAQNLAADSRVLGGTSGQLPLDTGPLSWPSLMRISKCVPQCRPRNFSASRTG